VNFVIFKIFFTFFKEILLDLLRYCVTERLELMAKSFQTFQTILHWQFQTASFHRHPNNSNNNHDNNHSDINNNNNRDNGKTSC
jgi:hypothetical protein